MDHSAGKEIENVRDPKKFDVRTVDTVHRYFSWICLCVLYDIEELVKNIPGKESTKFLDWFTYSDNTIDGRSKKKPYAFWEIDRMPEGTFDEFMDKCIAVNIAHPFMKGIDYSYYYEEE